LYNKLIYSKQTKTVAYHMKKITSCTIQ